MGQWGFGEFPWGLVYIVIDVDCFSRHSPQAKFGRPPFFVTKVLLKHSHTHLLSSHNHLLSTHLNYSEPAEPEIHTICLEKLCWNGSVALNCRENNHLFSWLCTQTHSRGMLPSLEQVGIVLGLWLLPWGIPRLHDPLIYFSIRHHCCSM